MASAILVVWLGHLYMRNVIASWRTEGADHTRVRHDTASLVCTVIPDTGGVHGLHPVPKRGHHWCQFVVTVSGVSIPETLYPFLGGHHVLIQTILKNDAVTLAHINLQGSLHPCRMHALEHRLILWTSDRFLLRNDALEHEFRGRHVLQGHADGQGVDPVFGSDGSDLGLL